MCYYTNAQANSNFENNNLSLAEAARWDPNIPHPHSSPHPPHRHNLDNLAADFTAISTNINREHIEKLRWQSAVRAAEDRGLNSSKSKEQFREKATRNSRKTRRHPQKHAKILLDETSLPFQEIAEITGLNIYQVVCIKLKSREAA